MAICLTAQGSLAIIQAAHASPDAQTWPCQEKHASSTQQTEAQTVKSTIAPATPGTVGPAPGAAGAWTGAPAEAGNIGVPDEAQLTYAASRGMAILTYNAQDFISLARAWLIAGREHSGIIISEQFSQRQFGELLRRVLRLLDSVTADEMHNQIVFLQQFQEAP
jgi:hypothetical protein